MFRPRTGGWPAREPAADSAAWAEPERNPGPAPTPAPKKSRLRQKASSSHHPSKNDNHPGKLFRTTQIDGAAHDIDSQHGAAAVERSLRYQRSSRLLAGPQPNLREVGIDPPRTARFIARLHRQRKIGRNENRYVTSIGA